MTYKKGSASVRSVNLDALPMRLKEVLTNLSNLKTPHPKDLILGDRS